ncbi:MAG TPA: transglutaminase-like domain-containing protein [Candidatus Binatia bacterium]|nr:transglutaminase-like domain-containing protein [Candidatus Binatia bacterium]
MAQDLYREFRAAVDRPEEAVDLGYAALTIGLSVNPHLDIPAYVQRIDQLAREVADRRDPAGDVYHSLAALNHVLFRQHGFDGNRDDYYDPRNSFLSEVLDRKIGIPITLCVLYMEVARRISVPVEGIGFPGHFLVKCSDGEEAIFIDPFHRGEIKITEDLGQMLEKLYGRKVALRPQFLEAAGKKQILKRMLVNLKAIYLRNNSVGEALSIFDHLIILDPAGAEEIRDRGSLYLHMGCFRQAREDFDAYLRLAPNAHDAEMVREQIASLEKQPRLLH